MTSPKLAAQSWADFATHQSASGSGGAELRKNLGHGGALVLLHVRHMPSKSACSVCDEGLELAIGRSHVNRFQDQIRVRTTSETLTRNSALGHKQCHRRPPRVPPSDFFTFPHRTWMHLARSSRIMHKHKPAASEAMQHKTDVHTRRTPATALHKLAQPSAAQCNQGLGLRTIISPRRKARKKSIMPQQQPKSFCVCAVTDGLHKKQIGRLTRGATSLDVIGNVNGPMLTETYQHKNTGKKHEHGHTLLSLSAVQRVELQCGTVRHGSLSNPFPHVEETNQNSERDHLLHRTSNVTIDGGDNKLHMPHRHKDTPLWSKFHKFSTFTGPCL